ncbi:MAG: ASCH domain-containing protein [Clostridiales bacterium]|nr:ASCH domain-containing protein [Clostridiales bacterium]
MTIGEFWLIYITEARLSEGTKYIDSFHFGSDEKLANELLALVLIGQKQATTSCLKAYEIEGDELPKVGGYSIVTDWDGTPKCVIQTTQVTLLSLRDMTFDICKREGEDECLQTWREAHIPSFTQEGVELGYEFTEDQMVVFEDFKLVYQA